MKKLTALILTLTMLFSLCAIPVAAETETDNRVWFDLNGNSRFFAKQGDGIYENRLSYADYLPGVDFAGFVAAPTGDFATDQAAITNPGNGGAMFYYTVGTPNPSASRYATTVFSQEADGSLYWTINGVSYRINTTENAIKTSKIAVDTSALTDADMIAKYESISKEAVIDVEDGRYKNVGLLAGTVAGSSRTAAVTLVYAEGEVTENITINPPSLSDTTTYNTGSLYFKNFTHSNDNATGGHGFIPFTIETNSMKTLTAIKIKDVTSSTSKQCFYVISAWGEMKTLAEFAAEIDALIAAATTVEELEAIDVEAIEEYYNCTLTAQRTAIVNKIAEIYRVEKLDDKPTYYYPIEYNRDAWFSVAEALEFGAFDASGNPWPTKDLEGNALDTTSPWFGTKGFVRLLGSVQKGASGFLIDSIKGVEGGKVSAQRYTSSACDTIGTTSKTLLINGNPSFELLSTDADGAENYIYNADGFKYKLGPIGGSAHRTADGGYNVRALGENEIYKFERVQEGAQKFGMLLASKQNNEGTSYAALEKIVVTYNDGKAKETKYLVVTNMTADNDSFAATTYDGDRLARLVVAVPKTVDGAAIDHTVGKNLKANAKIVSEKNSKELIGKAITVEDVVFPADFVVGESVVIADLGIGRNSAITNGRRYCPEGYANHYELAFGEDVASIEYQGGIGYAKSYKGAVLNSQVAYIPVEIPGASEDYLYYARFGRACGNYMYLMGASSEAVSAEEMIAELNAELDAVDYESITKEGCEALRVKIEALKAANEIIADSDFHTEALEAAEARIKDELAQEYKVLKLKRNFPISVATGANAKLFIDYDTYQTYKANKAVGEEWVPGLDFAGIVKADASKPYTSHPTGTDADVISGYSNAFLYKVDKTDATGKYSGYVNLKTKNGLLTWNVNGTDFVINPYEKVVKAYTPTDASGVEDAALRARFESLNNPVLDIKDGVYESITVLAGTTGKRTLTPTVIYKDGTSKTLSPTVTPDKTFVDGVDSQATGYECLQTLTNWSNLNSGGASKFGAITLTGFDTSKVIDKISFKTDGWGTPVFVISAFGETATIEDVLNSADASDLVKAKAALDIADEILAENNITADDLTVALTAKYNELKAATEAFLIEEITLAEGVATVKYVNTTSVDEKAMLIVAQYNADETELISVKYQPVTFEKGKTELTANVETNAANKVKVFVWKDLVDFFPLTANIFGK